MQRKVMHSRGIMLITVLFLVMILTMFASGTLILVINQQASTSQFTREIIALQAAEAGLNFALARLNANPRWQGCSPAVPDKLVVDTPKVSIYEHKVSGNEGCVEGKVLVGTDYGYFDIYFARQDNPSEMQYIKPEIAALPDPDIFLMSVNNTILIGGNAPSPITNLNDIQIANREMPSNSVLLVCRGMYGNVAKTIEMCFQIGPDSDQFNSVIIGGGNLTIEHFGTDEATEKIVLEEGAGGKSSILRACKDMTIKLSDNRTSYGLNNDYMSISGAESGGVAENGEPLLSPVPYNVTDEQFISKTGQDKYLPKLKLSDVIPDTSSFNKLKAGTYCILPREASDPRYGKSPLVHYYDMNTPPPNCDKSVYPYSDVSDTFETLFTEKKLVWDPKQSKLTFMDSFSVDSAVSSKGDALYNLNFIPLKGPLLNGTNRISLQVGPDKPDAKAPPIYLVNNINDNAAITIEGQLSGIGTVITRGDLAMEAESQLAAHQNNGISIYTGGSVTVNEMSSEPFLETEEGSPDEAAINEYNVKQSIFKKIHQFTVDKKDDPISSLIGRTIDGPPERAAETAALNAMGCWDYYKIPSTYFTAEEQGYLATFLQTNSVDGKSYLYLDMSLEGPTSFNNSYIDNVNEVFFDTGQPIRLFRIWHLDDSFNVPKPSTPDKVDKKGRIIDPKDSVFRGLIYTCQDFTVNTPKNSFILQGGLVALGGTKDGEYTGTGGDISIKARDCGLQYDSQYLSILATLGNNEIVTFYKITY